MKLLFLDIDGVLNNARTQARSKTGFLGLDPKLVKRFLDWLPGDVSVVLSSTWRTYDVMKQEVRDAGIHFRGETAVREDGNRGLEIKEFLSDFEDVNEYAILDDNDWNIQAIYPGHFVQTDGRYGLQDKDLNKLNEILHS
jgi:hypothetical protein